MDLETGEITVLGSHDKPVRCVDYNPSTGTVLTGGWDAKFNAWDPRSRQALVQSRPVPGKVRATWVLDSFGSCRMFVADIGVWAVLRPAPSTDAKGIIWIARWYVGKPPA